MSTQDTTVSQEPILTTDTDATLAVSNTTNLDPQTVEYNTTPEVVEYQAAVDEKESLEAYIGLTAQATDGISKQTEAVMQVQLARIDRLIGRVAVGIEAYEAGRRTALARSTITSKELQGRMYALCDYLNTHVANEQFHLPNFGLEEGEPDQGKWAKIKEWFVKFIAWIKEKLVGTKAKVEKTVEQTHVTFEKVKASKAPGGAEFTITAQEVEAMMYYGKFDREFEVDLKAIDWFTNEWGGWAASIVNECLSITTAEELEKARARWDHELPTTVAQLPGNSSISVDPDTYKLLITKTEKPTTEMKLKARNYNEREKTLKAGNKLTEIYNGDALEAFTIVQDAANGIIERNTTPEVLAEIFPLLRALADQAGFTFLGFIATALRVKSNLLQHEITVDAMGELDDSYGNEAHSSTRYQTQTFPVRVSNEGLGDWLGDMIRNAVKGKKVALNISHQRDLAAKLKETYMNPSYLKQRRITGDVITCKMSKWIAEGRLDEVGKRVGEFKRVAQRESAKTKKLVATIKPFYDYLAGKTWLKDQSKLEKMATSCPSKPSVKYDLDVDDTTLEGVMHVEGKVGPLDEKEVIRYATALHDITVMFYTNFETIVGKEWEDIYIIEKDGEFFDAMGPGNEFLKAAEDAWGTGDANYKLVWKLCHSIYLWGKWTEQAIDDADSAAVHMYFTAAIGIEKILDKAVA